jgi:hypothetical protein
MEAPDYWACFDNAVVFLAALTFADARTVVVSPAAALACRPE